MSYDTNTQTRSRIDFRLKKIQSLQSTMGIDSTKVEVKEVKAEQHEHWIKIQELDEGFYRDAYID